MDRGVAGQQVKYIISAAVGAVLIGALWFAVDQGTGQDQIDWHDSIADARQQATQEVREGLRPLIQQWRDSARVYSNRLDSAKTAMQEADEDFETQVEEAIADAEAGDVTAPQLENLREVHVKVVQACQTALNSCEAELNTTENRLEAFRDSIVPALEDEIQAERALAETAKRVASPSFVTRVGRNLEILGAGIVIGGIVTCAMAC